MRATRTVSAAAAVLVAAAGICVAGVVTATPAWAHDQLLGTSPAAGSTVDAVPAAVVLTFDKPALALGTALEVSGPSGDVASGAPVLVDTTVRQALHAGSPAGTYTVRWRVTSADGHPVSGSFTFTATASGGDPTASAAPAVGGSGATADPGAGSSVLWWAVTIAAVVLLAAGVVVAARGRRRRAARDGPGRDDGPERSHSG